MGLFQKPAKMRDQPHLQKCRHDQDDHADTHQGATHIHASDNRYTSPKCDYIVGQALQQTSQYFFQMSRKFTLR